jgi:hypothetical protein
VRNETFRKEILVFDNGRAGFASVFRTRHTFDALAPLNTTFRRARFRTSGNVMITDTLDTFVGIYVVDLFTRGVIVFVNNRFYRTLVDTSGTVDA